MGNVHPLHHSAVLDYREMSSTGADVVHPAPGSEGRPSFTSLVANVDSDTSKYIAPWRVQTSRQKIIDDLKEMVCFMVR